MTASEIVIIGVDIGLSGGVCVLLGRSVLLADRMPTLTDDYGTLPDGEELHRMLREAIPPGLPVSAYLERVFIPGRREHQAVGAPLTTSGSITLGASYGIVVDCVRRFGPYNRIESRGWQKVLGVDDKNRTIRKAKAVARVKLHWPMVNLAPGKCKSPQSGIADAVCIAEYGQSLECGVVLAKRRKDRPVKRRKGA